MIMNALSKNPFSVGATISVDNHEPIAGWIWKVTEQWRYTMFVPDMSHKNPHASHYNMDVLLITEPEGLNISNHLSDLTFSSAANLVVLPFVDNWQYVLPPDPEAPEPSTSSPITTNYNKLIYIFGTGASIKTAVNDINMLLRRPSNWQRKTDEQHVEHEYQEREEQAV